MTAQGVSDPGHFVQTVLLVDDRGLGDQNLPAEDNDLHAIPTKEIVDALADTGTSCSVLAPGSHNDPDRDRVVKLATATDVLVLDWTLPPTADGKRQDSAPILDAVIAHDVGAGGRLRLIAIYTAYERPDDIVGDAEAILRNHGITPTTMGHSIEANDIRIVVIGKPTSRADVRKLSGQQLAEELPRLFVESFANGLLRRVALAGVASIRGRAHELLTDFTLAVDRSFVSHRAMAGASAAEEFARTLVLDGFATLLEEANVERWVEQEGIDDFLDRELGTDVPNRHLVQKKGSKAPAITLEKLRAVLSDTSSGHDTCGTEAWDNVGSLTSAFFPGKSKEEVIAAAEADDERFTSLATFARRAHPAQKVKVDPHLRLGSVVKVADAYMVCVQPLCDSIRLDSDVDTSFPFFPLQAEPIDGYKFDLVVAVADDTFVRLSATAKFREMKLVPFRPNDGELVVARPDEAGVRVFVTAAGDKMEWLGQLRLDHAHRLAASLGDAMSRIGLDEPEWSRRRAARA